MCMHAQLCPILWDPVDCSPPSSSDQGILQARILECVPFPAPEDLPDPGIKTQVTCISCIVTWILYHHASWELPRLKEPLDSQRVDNNMKTGLRRRETSWCGEGFANPPQRSQWERREAGDRRRKKGKARVFLLLPFCPWEHLINSGTLLVPLWLPSPFVSSVWPRGGVLTSGLPPCLAIGHFSSAFPWVTSFLHQALCFKYSSDFSSLRRPWLIV